MATDRAMAGVLLFLQSASILFWIVVPVDLPVSVISAEEDPDSMLLCTNASPVPWANPIAYGKDFPQSIVFLLIRIPGLPGEAL